MNRDFLEENKNLLILGLAVFFSYLVLHLVFGRHKLPAYDMYTYLSFSRHYAENWFYTVIPSQAHGLEIVTYPSLLFRVIAILSFIPLIDYIDVYIFLMSLGVTTFSFAFYYMFKTIFGVQKKKSYIIILFIAFSPGLLKFTLVHGQLPLIIGSIFSFLSVAFFYRLINGENVGTALILSMVLTAYTHHFSFLIMTLMIIIISLIHLSNTVSRIDYLIPVISISAILAIIGLLPMIREMLFGISQGEIFHGSRNPLMNTSVFHQYLTSTYGLSILGLPLLFKDNRSSFTVNILSLFFLVTGLGFVTPINQILFQGFADFLVYDRFSLMASLFLSGLIGLHVLDLEIPELISENLSIQKVALTVFIITGLLTVFWANQLHLGSYTGYDEYNKNKTQPATQYLNDNASENYLYVTHGHRPPVGEINRHTDVPTLETGYFQGRRIEFFGSWGKADRLPQSEFKKIIENSSNLSLKYVLSYSDQSEDWMSNAGWQRNELEGPGTVWINPNPIPEYESDSGEKRFIYSIAPLGILILSMAFLASQKLRSASENVLERLRYFISNKIQFSNPEKYGKIWIISLPILIALPAFLTSGSFPAGIDTPAHLFKIEMIEHMLSDYGRIYNWTDSWYNGYPFMAMYPPLTMYLTYILKVIVQDMALAYNIMRVVALLGVSSTVYILLNRFFSDWRTPLFGATLSVLCYPLYSNLFTVGRFASALSIPLYLLLIHLLFRDDIFQKKISRGHVYLGLIAAIFFLTHSMMAYLFIFTGILFSAVYRDRVLNIGLKPLIVISLISLSLASPYLIQLIQHLIVNNPSWYVHPQPFDLSAHIERVFNIIPPLYFGLIHAIFLLIGLAAYRKFDDKFMQFSILNFLFFYTFYWMRDFHIASAFIPFSAQLDLSRLELLFTIFGIFIAAYGFKYIIRYRLSDIDSFKKTLFVIGLIGVAIIDLSPMVSQSANWSPEFEDSINDIPIDDNYRAIGAGMRQWDSYLLWKMDVDNVFGWFNQGNPNTLFSKELQRSGGRWYGWNFSHTEDPKLQKNLMQISNTKYIITATGEWLPENRKKQVKGLENISHHLDEKLLKQIKSDNEFRNIYSRKHLEIYELERSMSYCEHIRPVWIEENYSDRATEMLREDVLPEFPIKGKSVNKTGENTNVKVSCQKENPYTISVKTDRAGWILVKESYYPFWERSDKGEIYNGFGFMVLYVEDDTTLEYQPRSLSTLSIEDVKKFLIS